MPSAPQAYLSLLVLLSHPTRVGASREALTPQPLAAMLTPIDSKLESSWPAREGPSCRRATPQLNGIIEHP